MADLLLFDTTILIDLFRDDPRPEEYFDTLPDDTGLLTHAMVQAEVMVGINDAKELAKNDRLFRRFEMMHPNEADSAQSLVFFRRLHLSHKIDYPDCLIAATAIRLAVPIVTINDRHFRLFKGLKIIRPY